MVSSGVRCQALFSIHVNDLPDFAKSGILFMFADDTTITVQVKILRWSQTNLIKYPVSYMNGV